LGPDRDPAVYKKLLKQVRFLCILPTITLLMMSLRFGWE
jgi:hypothetical protein